MATNDFSYWRCDCGEDISGETIVDPTFLPRVRAHEMECRVVALRKMIIEVTDLQGRVQSGLH